MYKVKPEDVIPTRTKAKIDYINRTQQGIAGALPKVRKKAEKLWHSISDRAKIMTDLPRSELIPFVADIHKLADLANSASAKNAVCAKGCSWCCKVNVEVNALESAYIEYKTGYKVVEKPYSLKAEDKNIPYCPFLDEQTATCKIHKYRPLMCRSFFTFDDPKLCEDSSNVHGISAWHNVTATKVMWEMMREMTQNNIKDIRHWFDGETRIK